MKTEMAVVVHGRTGKTKRTRTGGTLIVDLNDMPRRTICKWEKQGFYFPLPIKVRG